jgi:lipooligosaccharide transport system ATP-binding protein
VEPIVVAHHLTKVYGSFVAVDDIDFAVATAECFGFLGPNGAGKTTTIRMLYAASPPSGGELSVAGLDIRRAARQVKALIGVVPQENNLDPDLTVLQNLLVYARYFDIPERVARERAEEALDLLQLADRRTSAIDELSGGMKRRLLIARALINHPRLLILDEPTTGLDPQARHLVWQKLRLLKGQGVTMILTTHYMEEAARLCDRLVIMDHGRILAAGQPEELVARYVGTEVLELQFDRQERRHFLGGLNGLNVVVEEAEDAVYLFAREPHVLDALLPGLAAYSGAFIRRPATLEDVFLRLAGRGLRE